jgi:hypothetical protein
MMRTELRGHDTYPRLLSHLKSLNYEARDLASIRRNHISANSISIAIFPRVRGMYLPGFCGSGCCSMEMALTVRPLTMWADRSPCQITSTTFHPSRISKSPSFIMRPPVGSGGGAPAFTALGVAGMVHPLGPRPCPNKPFPWLA